MGFNCRLIRMEVQLALNDTSNGRTINLSSLSLFTHIASWTLMNSDSYPFRIFGNCYSTYGTRWCFFIVIVFSLFEKRATHLIICFPNVAPDVKVNFERTLHFHYRFIYFSQMHRTRINGKRHATAPQALLNGII